MGDDAGRENGGNEQTSLRARDDLADRILRTSFAAMAEALRASAETMQRIDATQRRIADTIERGDRAQQVVASTRALNETFRGLTDIQKGLLDAVIRGGGRSRGLLPAFAAITVLALLLGFLLYERWAGDNTVSRELLDAARREASTASGERDTLQAALAQAGDLARQADARVVERDATIAALERAGEDLRRRVADLEEELEENKARLKNYLAVKDLADRAGAVELRNMELERENRELLERIGRHERELEGLMVALGEKRIAEQGPDPEAIRASAREMGVIPPEETDRPPGGEPDLSPVLRRQVRRQLNHLLQQSPGEESYEVLAFGGLKDGATLTDVRLGRYRNAVLLNSLSCKELDLLVDPGRDTLELRCRDGFLVSTRRPGEQVPLGEDGHFVFLKGLGIRAWLEQADADVAPDGRLTWKTSP